MWVLLKDYNDYDQHGSYFVAAFLEKPSFTQLRRILAGSLDCLSDDVINHVLAGGGRIHNECKWFTLEEVKPGEVY